MPRIVFRMELHRFVDMLCGDCQKLTRLRKCLTLGPTVLLKAEIASPEDKEYLAGALFYLRQPSTNTVEGDARKLGLSITE